MRLVQSQYLDDGRGYSRGQKADVIEIESPADFDLLLSNVAASNFYDGDYLHGTLGYDRHPLKIENLCLAAMLDFLLPGRLLELGCGKGDVLFLLHQRDRAQVRGLDISPRILEQAWPAIRDRLDCGDLLDLAPRYQEKGLRFNTICGFDIWEHLHPAKLPTYIQTMLSLAEDDALFFFIIPGFGPDRVFGEIFPLEFAENRAAFEARQPFPYLTAGPIDPPIPVSGHLIWAHTEWWERQFSDQGLVRCHLLEKNLHKFFDDFLHIAQRSFYIFRRQTKASERRERERAKHPINQFMTWHLLHLYQREVRRLEKDQGRSLVDADKMEIMTDIGMEKLLWHLDHDITNLAKPLPWRAEWLIQRFMPLHLKDKLWKLMGR